MLCCFPTKKAWCKDIKPQYVDIKPKPKVNMFVQPVFEGDSPEHEPVDKRMNVTVESVLFKDMSPTQSTKSIKI